MKPTGKVPLSSVLTQGCFFFSFLSFFLSFFPELKVLEVLEVFDSDSSLLQDQTKAERSSESTVENNRDTSTCTLQRKGISGSNSHPKLCKVPAEGNFQSLEQVQPEKQQNSSGQMLKSVGAWKIPHRTAKDILVSALEKLVESAHFGKLGKHKNGTLIIFVIDNCIFVRMVLFIVFSF